MNFYRWILVLITALIALYFLFQLEIWSSEYKDLFFYMNDWKSWVMAFALIFVIGYILKRLVVEEVKLTAPKRRR